MKFDDLLQKIQSRGYWRINFRPIEDAVVLKTLQDCKSIVENNHLELRGWDYPHFPRRAGDDTGLLPMNNYYRGWIDWENHVEFWHMYQSGQFLHYLALREDWLDEDAFDRNMWKKDEQIKPLQLLGVTGTTFQISEIFEFLNRLVKAGVYKNAIDVSIVLNNTEGRKLWVDHPMRVSFMTPRVAGENAIYFNKQYTVDEITQNSKELSFDAIKHFFERFGWGDAPLEMIKKDQEDLLARRI